LLKLLILYSFEKKRNPLATSTQNEKKPFNHLKGISIFGSVRWDSTELRSTNWKLWCKPSKDFAKSLLWWVFQETIYFGCGVMTSEENLWDESLSEIINLFLVAGPKPDAKNCISYRELLRDFGSDEINKYVNWIAQGCWKMKFPLQTKERSRNALELITKHANQFMLGNERITRSYKSLLSRGHCEWIKFQNKKRAQRSIFRVLVRTQSIVSS